MKILVDTSVWSLALRRKKADDSPEAVTLKRLIEDGEDIYLTGIILQEILQGVKYPKDFNFLEEHLSAFPLIELTRQDYVKAAALKNHLMNKGIQASTVDALIASAAVSYDCYLLAADRDFRHIAAHSRLKLLEPGY